MRLRWVKREESRVLPRAEVLLLVVLAVLLQMRCEGG